MGSFMCGMGGKIFCNTEYLGGQRHRPWIQNSGTREWSSSSAQSPGGGGEPVSMAGPRRPALQTPAILASRILLLGPVHPTWAPATGPGQTGGGPQAPGTHRGPCCSPRLTVSPT